MARQGITGEQVFTAADELRDEGVSPTVQTVRERIGSGSFSTINTHLGEWKAQNAGAAVADIPDIPDKVQAAFAQIWAKAARIAQEGFDTQREALEVTQREMERERASMAEEIERLEQALEEKTGLLVKVGAELEAERTGKAEAEKQAAALTVENARISEQVKGQERLLQEEAAQEGAQATEAERMREREQWEKEREQDHQQRAHLQTDLEGERAARSEAEKDNARLQERADAAEKRAGELKAQVEGLQKQIVEAGKQTAKPRTTRKKSPASKPGRSSE